MCVVQFGHALKRWRLLDACQRMFGTGVSSDSFRYVRCRRSDDEYLLSTEPVRSRNERHLAAAQHQHALAMQQWQRDYDLALMEWNSRQVDTHVCSQIHADCRYFTTPCLHCTCWGMCWLLGPHIAEEH